MLLNEALERPCAVNRIVAILHNEILRSVCHLAGDLPVAEPAVEVFDLQIDDLSDVVLR